MLPAVVLTDLDVPATLIEVPGVAIEGLQIEPRQILQKTYKFWGLRGESRINGQPGGRTIRVPVIIYHVPEGEEDPRFNTARKLADYIDYELNTNGVGLVGQLSIYSESDHRPFEQCVFEGAMLNPENGIKLDHAGTLGGGYFAELMLEFRQLACVDSSV